MSSRTLKNWRKLDWDTLDIPQLECIRSKLLRERQRLQNRHNRHPDNKNIKRKLGYNRKRLDGIVKRVNRLRKGSRQLYVQGLALCLALRQEGLDSEVRDLLKRARKIGSTRVDQWLDDFVSYSKKKSGETAVNPS